MNELSIRKRLLIAQADQHRHAIEAERDRALRQIDQARDFVGRNRWWLVVGAIAGGFLLAPRWRQVLGWLPVVPDLLRLFRR